ncbi:MAG: phenylalanine--tRNA ligase subunit alpha [Defluviitaleaceae bacterium]|nr:phenylalanine--tRNA ligase subunit alpha [Defluviitaleaceae bacterium]MCL2240523.1 phenylalanine--tRNA ligase subunit alpha [Defluviitaleaceae bacterium]
MLEKLTQLRHHIEQSLRDATPEAIEAVRVGMLGKKGEITAVLKGLGQLEPQARKIAGQAANELRDWAQSQIDQAKAGAGAAKQAQALTEESIDITLPGRRRGMGRLHPITQVYGKLEELFLSLGFDIVEGPHIETVYHNFDALNTPESHPSRDESDTFYFDENYLLRCHTSPMQVRVIEKQKPPIRVVVPGKVFRRDEVDATHTPVFHQLEGLVIDKGVHMGDLRGIMELIAGHIFGPGAKIRLRPSFFPFTEPSAEVDITCYVCDGKASRPGSEANDPCRVCKDSGWVELWGCGMVHPQVLRTSGIDPGEYSGYAFGLGVDRITSALYGITDPRLYFENDVQFLRQF